MRQPLFSAIFTIVVTLITASGFSQTQSATPVSLSSGTDKCSFDVIHQQLLQTPVNRQAAAAAENRIQQYIMSGGINRVETLLQIPVVIHVMHLGETVGTGSNISDAQIQSSINNLNDVYRGRIGASPLDLNVEFVLAKQDPNCNASTGIKRYNASGITGYAANGVNMNNSNGASEASIKALATPWPTTNYFNIWIVTELDGNNGGFGFQGYANFYAGNASEGSIMMSTVFGYDPTNVNGWGYNGTAVDNSTPVHEFGHYFHLYHTFQGDGTGSTCPNNSVVGTGSDGCADTEIHKRETSTCPTGQINGCTSLTYGLNTLNNWMSYYSCQDRFTLDQKTRVRATLTTEMLAMTNSKGLQIPIGLYSAPLANSCTPQTSTVTGMTNAYSAIGQVEMKGMINTSGYPSTDNPTTGTLDMTSDCQKLITVDVNEIVALKITTLFNSGNSIKGYIDYNNNGSFEISEEIFNQTGVANNTTVSQNITIPNTATTGTTLRMRLIQDLGPISGPCHNSTYGQAEDYAIYINTSCITPTVVINSTSPSCNGGSNGSATAVSTGGVTPYTYTWNNGVTLATSSNLTAATYVVTVTENGGCSTTKSVALSSPTGITLSSTMTQSSCSNNDGSINLSVSGGTSPYSFSWSNAATSQNIAGLTAATYTTTTTDNNGCSATHSKVITQNCVPIPTTSVTPASCGTTVNLIDWIYCTRVSGATKYEWEINDGINPVMTYIWNSWQPQNRLMYFANMQGNTTYAVRVRANVNGAWGSYGAACNITTAATPVPQVSPSTCGSTVNLIDWIFCDRISGATKYEWEINDGVNPAITHIWNSWQPQNRLLYFSNVLPSTTYAVRVRAYISGNWSNYGTACNITTAATPIPQVSPSTCGSTVNLIDWIFCDRISGATKYEWEINDGVNPAITHIWNSWQPQNRLLYFSNVLPSTTYAVRVRAYTSGNWSNYGTACNITTGLAKLASSSNNTSGSNSTHTFMDIINLKVYPNPTQQEFILDLSNIPSSNQSINIDIYDMFGKKVYSSQIKDQQNKTIVTLNKEGNLASGIYLINVIIDNEKIQRKIIIQ